ncbi:MAG: hypothetical protein KatS3mg005_1867 [Bryobacteraceae bacterium]|nr:MAG: hypothetical protein KatS3mg005_1867 [Bryobacteraceae bacterium]
MPLTIYELCQPRPDVLSGATRDEQFMADLSQVVNGTALPDYLDPALFFRNTYPTRGLRELLKAVCLRLSGKGGEVSPILRLGTQYGGGKTHGLIALVHAARGMQGVANATDFLDPQLIPREVVRIAALDGENTDPANGRQLEPGLKAFSLWGELAYQLGGAAAYERLRNSDEKHIAPGAEVLRELFGSQPTLIMLDEISVYLRKVERAFPDAGRQFAAFVHALFKAVASTPRVALVYTLAIGEDEKARDAYREENERAAAALAEAESVAVRSSTALNPTAEDETVDVLRVRLFESVDRARAAEVIDAYAQLWARNRDMLPAEAVLPELKEQFARTYPFHPRLLEMLTEKTASLSTFQRTRGMLRLLARTVHLLWRNQPPDTFSIHIHHMDPGFEPIRTEILEKIGMRQYAAALKADVAAVPGDERALAQRLDEEKFPGLPPVTSYAARTIFWHTLAFGDHARGISPEQLRLAVCSPALEPSFIDQARTAFQSEALFLDDRPGAPLRFMAEANLNQVIGRFMRDVDAGEVRAYLRDRIDKLFNLPRGPFNAILFPMGPWEVPDDLADPRPLLVVLNYESTAIPANLLQPPSEIEEIFQYKGSDRNHRELKNNLVFVAAAENGIASMKMLVRRKLALEQLRKPSNQQELADYQIQKVNAEYHELDLQIAQAILQCYRHVFYPSATPMAGTTLPLGHTILELTNPDNPGNGQTHVERVLHEQKKLLTAQDAPDSPAFVARETGLSGRGEMTLQQLRLEYRKAPKLSILLHDTPLLECVRAGIQQGRFIYREGDQVWGPGDPSPVIRISDNSFLHTMEDARAKNLWPRAEPLRVSFLASPTTIARGQSAEITVTVTGGVPPYTFTSSDPRLNATATRETRRSARVNPEATTTYQVEVTDSRGARQQATTMVAVREGGVITPVVLTPAPPAPPPPTDYIAEGPLAAALSDLWEKARKARCVTIQRLVIRMFEAVAAWKVHQAMATVAGARVTARLEATLAADGIERLRVEYAGTVEKANATKGFLDLQLRAATESDFTAVYTVAFEPALRLDGDAPERFAGEITRYGGGEAFVEAQAGPAA